MDALDRALLSELAADPRLATAELARRIEVSVPTARDRLRRLQESGVIRGYRLDIDPAALGYPVAAFVRVRPGPGQLPKIAELAQSLPQVSECHRVTGEDCFLIKVHAADVSSFEDVLDRFCSTGRRRPRSSSPPPYRRGHPDWGDHGSTGSGHGRRRRTSNGT
ncbi:Lrp/AsnC family transcriptional regulator [Streptomyces sp. Amel2xB2]|uniref:Lrp/AsnC family transcriptional regulator n=1 Tax=Streptomyces sp. Amel2xB2 TaxID=1305829 RepID=UPI0021AB9B6F|nr:Lrp/AsnC family transcriptional regulator [Streptomyces sp. Amel2xB2]